MTESYFSSRFTGKVALITGAAQGIGYATAERLGREGASVVVADIAEEATNKAVKYLEEMGVKVVGVVGDLSSISGAEAAMKCAQNTFGGLHVLINNVGGTIWTKPFWYYSESEIHDEVNRSFWPTMWCSHVAIEYLRRSGGGAIVNIGSNAATAGVYRIPYSACKGAVISLTKSLAVELAGFNIRVNCISPGRTLAPERKTPRESCLPNKQELEWRKQFGKLIQKEELIADPATAEELAAVIAFIASHEANHITGEVIEMGRRGVRLVDVLGSIP